MVGGVLSNPVSTIKITLLGVFFAISSNLLAIPEQDAAEYVRARFLQHMKQPFKPDKRKKALIIGDSHAQDLYNGILENAYLSNYQISTRYIPTRCQIFLGININSSNQPALPSAIKAEDKALCLKSDNLYKARKQLAQADLIILAASWRKWSAKALPQTIRNLHLKPKQTLFVIGRKSFRKAALKGLKNYQHLSPSQRLQLRNPVDEHQMAINRLLQNSIPNKNFIDIHKLTCGDADTCPVFTDQLEQISFDGGHFSRDGARYITKILFEHSKLGKL